jgi:hypothetical protein
MPTLLCKHVDAAEPREAALDQRLDLAAARDVGGVHLACAALAFDDRLRLRRRVDADIDREDPCAFAREQGGGRLAVAPAWPDRAGAGDDRDFSGQPANHHRSFRFLIVRPSRRASPIPAIRS